MVAGHASNTYANARISRRANDAICIANADTYPDANAHTPERGSAAAAAANGHANTAAAANGHANTPAAAAANGHANTPAAAAIANADHAADTTANPGASAGCAAWPGIR
jgi:hypothetical protein